MTEQELLALEALAHAASQHTQPLAMVTPATMKTIAEAVHALPELIAEIGRLRDALREIIDHERTYHEPDWATDMAQAALDAKESTS